MIRSVQHDENVFIYYKYALVKDSESISMYQIYNTTVNVLMLQDYKNNETTLYHNAYKDIFLSIGDPTINFEIMP